MQKAIFDAVDLNAWRERAERELRGVPLSKLSHATPEGFDVAPLYVDAPAASRNLGASQRAGRDIGLVGLLDGPVAGELTAAIAAEKAGGAGCVALASETVTSWPDAGPELIFSSNGTPESAAALAALAKDQATVMAALNVRDWRDDKLAGQDIAWLKGWPTGRAALAVDLRAWHEAGADAATELGAGLSTLIAALRRLDSAGLAAKDMAPRFIARIPVASDFLMQTAKLRAWSGLVTRVLELLAVPLSARPLVFAESSRRALTRSDPWVNLLRGTASAFAAITGGADFIGIQPFDVAARQADQDALRLARNTLHILISESHVDEVTDPAAGSYAIETWTSELQQRAWALVQQVERAGGAFTAAGAQVIADGIAGARTLRTKRLRTRQAALIGTTLFVDAHEQPLEGTPSDLDARLFGPRDSAAFEALRDAGKAAGRDVFIANIGPLGEQQARTSWVRDLFAAGGYRARDGGDGYGDAAEALAAFTAAPCQRVIISAADARLADLIPTLIPALRAKGVTRILCAGRPGANEAAWRAAGVTGFVYAGMDILALFAELLADMEA